MMESFEYFGTIDVSQINRQLAIYPEFWNAYEFRQKFPGSPHTEVSDIWLHFPSLVNIHSLVWYQAAAKLFLAREAVFALSDRLDAKSVDRVLITSLPPGGKIAAHSEAGDPYFEQPGRRRFHIVLNGSTGSTFHCGAERTDMLTGEIWSFDALQVHAVENNSDANRVHLIVDLLLGVE